MSSRTLKTKKAKAKMRARKTPEERRPAAQGPAEEMLFGTELEEL